VLSVSTVVGRSWEVVKDRGLSLGLLLIVAVVSELIIQAMMMPIERPVEQFFVTAFKGFALLPLAELREGAAAIVTSMLTYPLTMVLSSYVAVGLARSAIDIVRGKPVSVQRLLKVHPLTWAHMVALQIILFMAYTVGYLMLLIPGIVLTLGMALAGLVLVDEETDALSAMSRSWALMTGAKMALFRINAFMTVLCFGGLLLCVVGVIPVLLVWVVVPVVVYEHLRGAQPSAAPEPYPNIDS